MQGTFIIVSFLLVLHVQAQGDTIPVEYGLPAPWQFETGHNDYWAIFDMCHIPPYQNCYIRTRVNLPDLPWDVNAGQYINLNVFSATASPDGDQCTFIVANDINAAVPGIADFLYKTGGGNKFYIQLANSVATGLQGTLDVHVDCDGASQRSLDWKREIPSKIEKELIVPCGARATLMGMSYRPVKPLNVITSQKFSDWLQLKIPICMGSRYTGLYYKAQATDTQSAMSSRACTTGPCTAAADVAVDRSGSALNSFTINNFNNRTLYLAIEGWGNYQKQNNFIISLEAML
jgi:hypothetical protein